jgi:hypothetical protein
MLGGVVKEPAAMPYRVYFPKDGTPYIETDSVEEAIAVAQSRPESNRKPAPTLNFPKQAQPENAVKMVFLGINENARKFLVMLAQHSEGVRGDQFSAETKIEAEKFGGILGGLSKIAKNYGFKLRDFVDSKLVVKGSERYRFLRPTKLLIENQDKLRSVMKDAVSY